MESCSEGRRQPVGHYRFRSQSCSTYQLSPVYKPLKDRGYVYIPDYHHQTGWSHDSSYSNRLVYRSNPSISSAHLSYDRHAMKNSGRSNRMGVYSEDSLHVPTHGYAEDVCEYQEDYPATYYTEISPRLQAVAGSVDYVVVPRHLVATTRNGCLAVPQVSHYCPPTQAMGRHYSKDSMVSYRSSQQSVSAFSNASAESETCLRDACCARRPSYDWCESVWLGAQPKIRDMVYART